MSEETGMMEIPRELLVKIYYVNWRGVAEERIIKPISLSFESTEWHPEKQWLLNAYCLSRKDIRKFAVKDITNWQVDNV